MNYNEIDPIIKEWASKNKFLIYNKYKDEEVRSVNVVSSEGRTFQIWIDPPLNDKILVHAWDFKKRNKEYNATKDTLPIVLEEATSLIQKWMTCYSQSLSQSLKP